MKKAFIILFIFLLVPCICFADLPDIGSLSFDELVQLRDQINIAMWHTEEWQEVTVPGGLWKIGEDIPAGHWSIRLGVEHGYSVVWYFEKPNEFGRPYATLTKAVHQEIATEDFHAFNEEYIHETDFDMKDGWYFYCENTTIFTPYQGKPSLGFK